MANTFEINFTADAWIPPATAHPDRGVIQNRVYLAFNDETPETVYSQAFRMPAEYAAGTVKFEVGYIMATATSGTVEWEVAVEAVTDADALDLDTASGWDTVNTGTATVPATAGYLDVITVTLTNKDSVAAGDMVRISLSRDADDATNDTATGDARVLWCCLYEEAA